MFHKILIVLWIAAVTTGVGALSAYSLTPGKAGESPHAWPPASTVSLSSEHPTLMMIVHPQCSCSKASLGELAKIVSKLQAQVKTYVLFVTPKEEIWQGGELWKLASKIPNTTLVRDIGGAEAKLFGSFTSGQVMLYYPSGELLFSGGITAGRGHEGDNTGADAIVSLIRSKQTKRSFAEVFGCGLFG